MAVLTINANDVEDAPTIQVRYRVLNSGLSYTVLTLTPSQLPYAVNGVQSAQYEVGVRKLCSNSAYSDWVVSQSTPCPGIVSFQVVKTENNFVVTATLAGPQNIIKVKVTDPNGGVQNYSETFAGQSGTFNIPVPSNLYGAFSFQGQGVCDNDANPVFASVLTAPVSVNVPSPAGAFIVAVAPALLGYGGRIASINGEAGTLPDGLAGVNQYANMAPQSFPFDGTIPEQNPEVELVIADGTAVKIDVEYSDGNFETFNISNNSGTYVIHLQQVIAPNYVIVSLKPE